MLLHCRWQQEKCGAYGGQILGLQVPQFYGWKVSKLHDEAIRLYSESFGTNICWKTDDAKIVFLSSFLLKS